MYNFPDLQGSHGKVILLPEASHSILTHHLFVCLFVDLIFQRNFVEQVDKLNY